MDVSTNKITNDVIDDYVDQSQNVFAVLYQAGNQGFNTQADTRQPAVRSVCFGAGTPVDGADPFPAALCANAVVVMGGYAGSPGYPASSVAIQNMTLVGQTDNRLVRFNWTVGPDTSGYRYRLGLGTDMNADDQPDAAPAKVTCRVVAGGKCTTWTLEPQGPAALYRAQLSIGKGGKVVEGPNTYVGHYDMPFVETLTLK